MLTNLYVRAPTSASISIQHLKPDYIHMGDQYTVAMCYDLSADSVNEVLAQLIEDNIYFYAELTKHAEVTKFLNFDGAQYVNAVAMRKKAEFHAAVERGEL